MPIRKYKAEQIVTLLRQIEVQMANGKTAPEACKEAGIHTQTDYRWRKEYGGLKLDQAKRLKELEKENTRLKRLAAELSLEKQVLRDVALEGVEGGVHRPRSMPAVADQLSDQGDAHPGILGTPYLMIDFRKA